MIIVVFVAAFGGFTGLLFWDVPGLVVGALLGYGLAYGFRQFVIGRGQGIIRSRFGDSTFAIMGWLCREDSAITGDEIWAANRAFERLQLTAEQRDTAKTHFDRGRASGFDLHAELGVLRQVAGGHRTLLPVLLQVQAWALAEDGALPAEARTLLGRVATNLIVSEAELDRLEVILRSTARGDEAPLVLDDAYTVLRLEPSATDAEVKRSYRTLLNQHNPDTLMTQGMPAFMRPIVDERRQAIERAHETITEARQQAA